MCAAQAGRKGGCQCLSCHSLTIDIPKNVFDFYFSLRNKEIIIIFFVHFLYFSSIFCFPDCTLLVVVIITQPFWTRCWKLRFWLGSTSILELKLLFTCHQFFQKWFFDAHHPSLPWNSQCRFKCKIHTDVEWLQKLCCAPRNQFVLLMAAFTESVIWTFMLSKTSNAFILWK